MRRHLATAFVVALSHAGCAAASQQAPNDLHEAQQPQQSASRGDTEASEAESVARVEDDNGNDQEGDVVAASHDEVACPEPQRSGAELTYGGQVLDLRGSPVQGAQLRSVARVWEADYRSACVALFAEGTTGRDGRFTLSGPGFERPYILYTITAESGELFGVREVPPEDEHHVSIRMVPTRAVRLEVQCDDALAMRGLDRRLLLTSPSVTVITLPRGEGLRTVALPRTSSLPIRFEAEVRLPVRAEYRLQFDGPCGHDSRTIRVPRGDEPIPPVALSLPHSDAGAVELVFENPAIRVTDLISEGIFLRRLDGNADGRLLLERLAPGTYQFAADRTLRDQDPCVHEVEVRPGLTSQLRLTYENCYVPPPGPREPVEP